MLSSALADLLPDGLPVIDAAGCVTYVNEVGAGFMGATPRWCLGRSVAEVVHPDDVMLALSSMASVAGKERGTPIELRLRGPSGRWRLLELVGRDCSAVERTEAEAMAARLGRALATPGIGASELLSAAAAAMYAAESGRRAAGPA